MLSYLSSNIIFLKAMIKIKRIKLNNVIMFTVSRGLSLYVRIILSLAAKFKIPIF